MSEIYFFDAHGTYKENNKMNFFFLILTFEKNILNLTLFFTQLSVMAGPLGRSYGAATMAGKDERNGRINPALETDDDDLPINEAKRLNQQTAQEQVQRMINSATGQNNRRDSDGGGGGGIGSTAVPTAEQDNTAF